MEKKRVAKKTKMGMAGDNDTADADADNDNDNDVNVKSSVQRTSSFQPVWAGTFDPNTSIKVHTLVLGTHPSITSLKESEYFGHVMK